MERQQKNITPWQLCNDLIDDEQWAQPVRQTAQYTHERSITWAEYSYRYRMTAYGMERQTKYLRRKRIETKLYEVAMMSAVNTETHLRDYRQYYVPELAGDIHLVEAKIGDINEPGLGERLRDNMNFMFDSNLTLANSEEVMDLEMILRRAVADGVESLIRGPQQK